MELLLIELFGTIAAFGLFYLDHLANQKEQNL